MGYLHIDNLYRTKTILLFRECYALEKIHGTSAHIRLESGRLTMFSGGEKHERFVSLFDTELLTSRCLELGYPEVVVYGEAYGGKQQGQSYRYGKDLKFVAFDVKVSNGVSPPQWLEVPNARDVTEKLGLEFVHYVKCSTDLDVLNGERDAPSEQARRNGIEGDQPREGVVLRPLIELSDKRGERIIAKHKRDEERETKTPRKVEASELEVLSQAQAIADEWVTTTRLEHVLDHLGGSVGMERCQEVIKAMQEDVLREAKGEIVESREANKAMSKRTVALFKAKLAASITT